jgi:hypothetical protein
MSAPKVPSTARRPSSSSSVQLYEVFVKYQSITIFDVPPSESFLYVPGLNEVFYVSRNTMFKITVQAGLRTTSSMTNHFVQIMVNDHLIIGKELIPNTGQRINYKVGYNTYEVDSKGGYFTFGLASTHSMLQHALIIIRVNFSMVL